LRSASLLAASRACSSSVSGGSASAFLKSENNPIAA
jgi:hypothetical protein